MNLDISAYAFYKNLTHLSFIEEIWIYGSRARGDNQERSDIDLAIYCPLATPQNWLNILDIIDNADTLLKIDCIRLDTLPPCSALKASINTQGIKIYARDKN